jgi:hypothetical protein
MRIGWTTVVPYNGSRKFTDALTDVRDVDCHQCHRTPKGKPGSTHPIRARTVASQ